MNRAVSDTLGFVFAFALVTASVGAVYVSGIDGLQNAQRDEQLRNMERAFDVVDDNFRDIRAGGAPSRASEIKLPGGTLEFLDSTRITIQTNGTGCVGGCSRLNNTTTMNPRPVAYTDGDTRIVAVAGAVFRTGPGGSVMLSDPGWVRGPERALIPGFVTYPSGDRTSLGGDATVLLVAHAQSREATERIRSGSGRGLRVNATVRTVRADAWRRYFESEGYDITRYDETEEVVSAEFETERVYISETVVGLEIER
ncbi:DUF7289 family protein [Halorussus amylolyticus]|uniref:DUF7289 family protein n=1 Tax=Halorussus amylolyticus TaxID=1126242 RepID=UPI001048D22D|nr:hypothetical protein [Halorussus amylolyticus]